MQPLPPPSAEGPLEPSLPPDGASGRLRLEVSWLASELVPPEQPQTEPLDGQTDPRPLVLVGAGPAMAAYLRSCLRAAYRVSAAQDPEALLAEASLHAPGLFILEEGQRGWDAFAVCGRLRSDPRYRDLPVLVLVGEQEDEPEARCGAAFLGQPFNAAEVQARVASLLGG